MDVPIYKTTQPNFKVNSMTPHTTHFFSGDGLAPFPPQSHSRSEKWVFLFFPRVNPDPCIAPNFCLRQGLLYVDNGLSPKVSCSRHLVQIVMAVESDETLKRKSCFQCGQAPSHWLKAWEEQREEMGKDRFLFLSLFPQPHKPTLLSFCFS